MYSPVKTDWDKVNQSYHSYHNQAITIIIPYSSNIKNALTHEPLPWSTLKLLLGIRWSYCPQYEAFDRQKSAGGGQVWHRAQRGPDYNKVCSHQLLNRTSSITWLVFNLKIGLLFFSVAQCQMTLILSRLQQTRTADPRHPFVSVSFALSVFRWAQFDGCDVCRITTPTQLVTMATKETEGKKIIERQR